MRIGRIGWRSVTDSSLGMAPSVRCCLATGLLIYIWACLFADSMLECGTVCPMPGSLLAAVSLRVGSSCRSTLHGLHCPLRLRSRFSIMFLLALAGDIESNPGPRRSKFPCKLCKLAVKQTDPAVCCDNCDTWVHNTCSGLSSNMYGVLKNTSCCWICPQCGIPSFSSSFWSSDSCNTSNSFSCLTDTDNNTAVNDCEPLLTSSPIRPAKVDKLHESKRSKFRGLKIVSVNINGLRSKKTRYL